MDDLDNFFGDDAADAFCANLDLNLDHADQNMMAYAFDTETGDSKNEFREALMTNDELMHASLFDGKGEDIDKKEGLNQEEAGKLIFESPLADQFYPKDKAIIMSAVEAEKKEKYLSKDIIGLVRGIMTETGPTSKPSTGGVDTT